jgi:hypothetical protein
MSVESLLTQNDLVAHSETTNREQSMNTLKNADEVFGVMAVSILLLLTPWPMAMMVASAFGLVAWLVMLRGHKLRGGLLVAAISVAVAVAVAIAIALGRSH